MVYAYHMTFFNYIVWRIYNSAFCEAFFLLPRVITLPVFLFCLRSLRLWEKIGDEWYMSRNMYNER